MVKKLTKMQRAAKGHPCTLRIPNVCRPDPENSTSVLCHAPFPDRAGMRDHDEWAAIGCFWCHEAVDGRSPMAMNFDSYWLRGIRITQQYFVQQGLIVLS